MNYLASLDSSRDLQLICAKKFVNRFHLVLQISKIPTKKFLRSNSGLNNSSRDTPNCLLIVALRLCEAHLVDERRSSGPAWSCAATSASTRELQLVIPYAAPAPDPRCDLEGEEAARPAGGSSAPHSTRCCFISRHFPVSFSPGPALDRPAPAGRASH